MATVDQLAALRRATNLDPTDTTYTDTLLGSIIDTTGSLSLAAAQIWTELAARYAGMVDTTESGSSRKLSQLAQQALDQAARAEAAGNPVASGVRSFTIPIVRQ